MHLFMKKLFTIGIVLLFCSSCATIFNKQTTHVYLIAKTPIKVVMDKDTLTSVKNRVTLIVPRQKAPIEITVFNDTISKKITLNSKNSFAYWYNIYANYGIGMLIDKDNPKRYAYPKQVYVPMDTTRENHLPYIPYSLSYKNNIKITPLRLLMSHPGIELSYERYFSKKFSSQVSFAALFNLYSSAEEKYVGSGYQVAIEEKYFLKESANKAYFSIETGYFNIINANYSESKILYKGGKYAGDSLISAYRGNKTIFYLAPKFGCQMSVTERFIVDAYFGIGVKYEDRHYANTISPYDKWTENFWQVKVPFNIKIGWRF